MDRRNFLSTATAAAGVAMNPAIVRAEDIRRLHAIPDGVATVKVLKWGSPGPFEGHEGETIKAPSDTFVTLIPEVKDKCEEFRRRSRVTNLEELLGLPPQAEYDSTHKGFIVLEVSVNQNNIFRPCADFDVHTKTCSTGSPEGTSYQASFLARHIFESYQLPPDPVHSIGFPFTRLGYTYNWRPGADRYGASEYVIPKGAPVKVMEIDSTDTYCGN